jgi:hypothetical protein
LHYGICELKLEEHALTQDQNYREVHKGLLALLKSTYVRTAFGMPQQALGQQFWRLRMAHLLARVRQLAELIQESVEVQTLDIYMKSQGKELSQFRQHVRHLRD